MPKLTIVIGANGAGKSTWCERHREELPTNFYNADSIARGLGDWNSARKQREARELVDQAIERQLAARSDFGFESTYSGRSRPSIVRRAKALGYHVSAVFVGTRGPEINVDRVKARVADRSGHDVPETEIRRRWTAVQENLIATSDAIDSIQLIENSGSRARRVATVARSQQTEVAPDSPRWARNLARRIARAARMGQAAGNPKHPAMSAAIQHLSFSGALIERAFGSTCGGLQAGREGSFCTSAGPATVRVPEQRHPTLAWDSILARTGIRMPCALISSAGAFRRRIGLRSTS